MHSPLSRRLKFSSIVAACIFTVCCILPLGWIVYCLVRWPSAWNVLEPWRFHLRLLGRTLFYNLGVALLALLLALPAAWVLGRGRGRLAGLLAMAIPAALLMPSIVYAYGWMQAIGLVDGWTQTRPWLHKMGIVGAYPRPGGPADVLRCIWTLATWLWAVPAGILGLSLRRMDADLQQQALLDGALWRVTLRHLAGPALASVAIVLILAVQEFAVFEQSAEISVVATEVRTAYETTITETPPDADPKDWALIHQRQRAAAGIVTGLPLVAVIGLFAALAWLGFRSHAGADTIETSHWPRILDAGRWSKAMALGVVLVTVGIPLVSMMVSYRRPMDLVRVWKTFSPPVMGTLAIGLATLAVAQVAAVCGVIRKMNWPVTVGLMSFLVGGQILAIAMVWIYNRPTAPGKWIYNGPAIVVMAYVARYGWLAMWAARSTWSGGWRNLRDLAAVDGASPAQTARRIVLPLAWPVLLASGVLILLLAMTEVPATALLRPVSPRMFIPQLLTWVHKLRDDDMIEGSLLLAGASLALAGIGILLARRARRGVKAGER